MASIGDRNRLRNRGTSATLLPADGTAGPSLNQPSLAGDSDVDQFLKTAEVIDILRQLQTDLSTIYRRCECQRWAGADEGQKLLGLIKIVSSSLIPTPTCPYETILLMRQKIIVCEGLINAVHTLALEEEIEEPSLLSSLLSRVVNVAFDGDMSSPTSFRHDRPPPGEARTPEGTLHHFNESHNFAINGGTFANVVERATYIHINQPPHQSKYLLWLITIQTVVLF